MQELSMYTRYDSLGPSSRLRYYAFAEKLENAGYQVKVSPFFSRAYVERLYDENKKSRLSAAWSMVRRFATACHMSENIMLEYELLPHMPHFIEQFFLLGKRYVLNFDDNVWAKYEKYPALIDKYNCLIQQAAGVIVANDYLYGKVRQFNDLVIRIPTVVELEHYRVPQVEKYSRLTLCWIGTPITYTFLESHAEALRAMTQVVDFDLLVLAKKNLESRKISGVSMRFMDWSPENEAEILASCHIGIMPLDDDDFARGKSAFKIIQYMAAGLPTIASPIGENVNVVVKNETGLLARTPDEWADAVKQLADEATRKRMAVLASERAKEYSMDKYFPIYLDFLEKCFPDWE